LDPLIVLSTDERAERPVYDQANLTAVSTPDFG
jgi:hypothetical protein